MTMYAIVFVSFGISGSKRFQTRNLKEFDFSLHLQMKIKDKVKVGFESIKPNSATAPISTSTKY